MREARAKAAVRVAQGLRSYRPSNVPLLEASRASHELSLPHSPSTTSNCSGMKARVEAGAKVD